MGGCAGFGGGDCCYIHLAAVVWLALLPPLLVLVAVFQLLLNVYVCVLCVLFDIKHCLSSSGSVPGLFLSVPGLFLSVLGLFLFSCPEMRR